MSAEQRDPADCGGSTNTGGKGGMITTPGSLQDLRKSLYIKAKTEATWRFWGMYVHVCKEETLQEAYKAAKENDGAPGIDGVTFEAIEAGGVEGFLRQIRDELISKTYRPIRVRKKAIPKEGTNKVRILSIPAIRDRVVQGALKLILEPIFEADFQSGSYGYRPKRTAHEAVNRVAEAIVKRKTRVIDLDLRAYFDSVQHYLLLEKVAKRIEQPTRLRI
jgi:RNA-directed DNA polymerase